MHACLVFPALIAADVDVYGSVAERVQLTAPSPTSPLPTDDLPIFLSLTEANVRARGAFFDDVLRLSVDASAFFPIAAGFADRSPDGTALETIDDHDVAARRPFVVWSEGYLRFEPTEHLVLHFGKRRVVWGPGLAVTPTDVLNPPRDPTDPSFQRTGILLASVDLPFERFALTALASPAILAAEDGLPRAVLAWPDYPLLPGVDVDRRRDDALHYAAALRAYAFLLDTDLNAWIVYTNRYNDDQDGTLRGAATLSRNLFGEHAVHFEVLLQLGSTLPRANPNCATDRDALLSCLVLGVDPIEDGVHHAERLLPRILAGWRWLPEDGSTYAAEWLYVADGLFPLEHRRFAQLRTAVGDLARERGATGAPFDDVLPGHGGDGQPLRFAFTPVRRHYLFLSWMKPQLFDDWTLQASLIAALEDLSSVASGGIAWQAEEWLHLALWAFAPLPAPPGLGARVGDEFIGELEAGPFGARAVLEARLFF